MCTFLILVLCFPAVTATPAHSDSDLPVVDLEYVVQRATTFNHTSSVYHLSNIRYPQPPIAELRFQAARSPETNRTIQPGADGHICYQAIPNWFNSAPAMTPQLLGGEVKSTFVHASEHAEPLWPAHVPPPMPQESEDCLFLDVHVPKKAFSDRYDGDGAVVIVWIHGGGLTLGRKDQNYDPPGLLAQSVLQTEKDSIFVGSQLPGDFAILETFLKTAAEEKLGAFGWSGGPFWKSDGTANAGLLDQRFALEWVRKNIESFGGDPKKVTLVGESAGAASIFGHLTSYGGQRGPGPFQQSLTQSEYGFANAPSVGEHAFQSFLKTARVTSVQEARALSPEELRVANYIRVLGSQWGSFT